MEETSASLNHHSRYDAIEGLGLNSVPGIVEWVAHYISKGVVQFSEHLREKKK